MVVSFKNSKVGYGKPLVEFEEISLNQGSVYALIGANGSGKSTLLLSIAGIQPFLEGDVEIDGEKAAFQMLTDHIAFVDTKVVSSGQLKVYDVLKMGRYKHTNLWHKITDKDQSIIDEWVGQLNLKHLLSQNMNTLSDGQKQMVMIARALIEETPIIVLDEPTAFLDVTNTIQVMQLLKIAAKKHQKTILFTTHDINAALQLSDYISWIKDGKLQILPNQDASQKIPLSSIFDIDEEVIDQKTGNFKI